MTPIARPWVRELEGESRMFFMSRSGGAGGQRDRNVGRVRQGKTGQTGTGSLQFLGRTTVPWDVVYRDWGPDRDWNSVRPRPDGRWRSRRSRGGRTENHRTSEIVPWSSEEKEGVGGAGLGEEKGVGTSGSNNTSLSVNDTGDSVRITSTN